MQDKIKIRPIEETDADFLFEMMQDRDYQKHYLERLIPKGKNEAKNEVKKYIKEHKNKFAYYFIATLGKQRVGFLDIYKIMQKDKRASIGYGIKKEFWKKGCGTKICRLGMNFAKKELKIHSLEATAEPDNIGSTKVLENNGFVRVGVMKDYYLDRGKYTDRVLYWKILEEKE